MAVKKKGLGKGLDAMIPKKPSGAGEVKSKGKSDTGAKESQAPQDVYDGAINVPLEKVEPNRSQPRKNFDEDAIAELSDSISQYGILQPLLVQQRDDYYEIIAGERRWRAARQAGLKEIPVIVRDYSEQEIVAISLIENIQRKDLNAIEEARAYKKLMEEHGLRQEDVAERVSKSRAAITNSMRLLKLDDRVQQMLIDGTVSMGHARALLALEDGDEQYAMACKVEEKGLSVRDVEKLVKKAVKENTPEAKKEAQKKQELDFIYRDMEEKLKGILGTKVSIANGDGKGKIVIDYYSQAEFDRIVEVLTSNIR